MEKTSLLDWLKHTTDTPIPTYTHTTQDCHTSQIKDKINFHFERKTMYEVEKMILSIEY